MRLIILLFLSLLQISATIADTPTSVNIGLIFPLTGPMSSFGTDVARALPVLEEQFNSEQSKFRFHLILEDGKFGHSDAAITAAKKLVEVDGVKFLITGSSGETLQVAPYVEQQHILTVAGFSSHPGIKGAGDFVFRTYIDADRGIRTVAEHFRKHKIQRVAVITEQSSFTDAILQSLKKHMSETIVASEEFALADSDLSSLIARTRSKTPQAYYLNIVTPTTFIALFKRLQEAGIRGQFFTYYLPSLKEVQKSLGPSLNGTYYLDYPTKSETTPEFAELLRKLKVTADSPLKAEFNFRTNYNAVRVVYDAIMAVGPDPIKAKDFLYLYDRPSPTGRLTFDANGDVENLLLELKRYSDSPQNG